MKKDIQQYVHSCPVCQQNKYEELSLGGLLQPLPIPHQIWEDVSMDFIERLPRSEAWDTILVVVDRLSKYGHFITVKHPFTTASIAGIFVKEVVKLHKVPNSIISDRDKIFVSHFWEELFRLQGTQLNMSSSTTHNPMDK